jgi:membrane-bound serine protease (ClpP class)
MAPQGISNSFARSRLLRACWLALVALPVYAADVDPQPPQPDNKNLAALVRVHLPLVGSADQSLQTTIRRSRDRLLQQAREQKDARRPVLVLQLDAPPQEDEAAETSQFERAFALARFLCSREMAGVKTVAFVPHTLRGHGVLLALACEEIVMSAEAMIGEAGAHEAPDNSLRETLVAAYREIAETQRTIPVALAAAMIDPSIEVLQVEAEDGTHFLSRNEFEQFAADHEIIKEKVLVPAGTLAQFDGREGRQFGFVKYLASSREGLATALDVPVESLAEDESLAEAWRPVVIDISGELTPKLASRMETLLGAAVQQQGANWICVRIDSAGGDLAAGLRMASSLARLDANSVRTVAYVPSEAIGPAAVIALSCDQLAMHPTAKLAAVAVARPQRKPLNKNRAAAPMNAELAAGVQTIRESLAPRTDHSWSLLAAMIDPTIELATYQNKTTGETRWMSPDEVAAQGDVAAWQVVADVKERLAFNGQEAQQQGLAWRTVDTFDELKQQFGLEGEIPNPQPNMALEFVEALATPELAMILLMVGFAGIYIELRTPGVGAGAFIGAVALLLFFWSKYLHGTAGWLEVLLFAAGFCFVMLEVFVLPGFGIFGLGGGALMLASLVLASLTFVRPHSEVELEELAHSVGAVALSGLGVMAFIIVSRRYLPQAPIFRNMVLEPPAEDDLNQREAVVDYSQLIGAKGHAATDLRPAGKARINHELVDVIAEGEPLDSGTPVVVVEARGNRVVVRAVG